MKSIKELAKNPNFIPGIYNYCNRWCERCSFTSQCANYAIGEDRFGDLKNTDLNNAQFWERLAGVLSETMEMVREKAQEFGIDLDNLTEAEKVPDFEDMESHFLVQLCLKYEKLSTEWFKESVYVDLETAEFIESKQIELKDATEVIRWYQYLIEVKFRRALLTFTEEDEEFTLIDRNGSAKVALIGIDRSLAAWNVILNVIKDQAKSILEIVALLRRIKKIAEKQLPDARSFIRTGLDE
ncbi:MAG: hypothetical protein Q7J16_06270 [Candidatus Cloacimonadales bacterium]|nr:hypothetical protein [Candidatus Cloacimonadales bacterium]